MNEGLGTTAEQAEEQRESQAQREDDAVEKLNDAEQRKLEKNLESEKDSSVE